MGGGINENSVAYCDSLIVCFDVESLSYDRLLYSSLPNTDMYTHIISVKKCEIKALAV